MESADHFVVAVAHAVEVLLHPGLHFGDEFELVRDLEFLEVADDLGDAVVHVEVDDGEGLAGLCDDSGDFASLGVTGNDEGQISQVNTCPR